MRLAAPLLAFAVTAIPTLARADAPTTAPFAPNLYGQTGLLRTTSARAGGNLTFDFGAQGFTSVAGDSIVPGDDDFTAYTGGFLSASAAFLDVFELSLAGRAATVSNVARGASQFSVGDLYPSLKMGFTFLPVAVGIDVRGQLPTRIDRAGYDLDNWGVTTQGLITLDLHERMNIPLRAHINGGYVFQGGKYLQGDGFFEDNPNFYNGVDGQLLALASESWFYDSVIAGVGVEVPLPFVTPFLETWYRAAVGVPANRGAGGNAYDAVNDAHLIVTPGARVALGSSLTLDLGVDIGVLGTGGGGTDLAKTIDGTPLNPVWAGRMGITGTFDPWSTSSSSSAPPPPSDGKPPAGTDPPDTTNNTRIGNSGLAMQPGRIVGWVTNKDDDDTVDAEIELWSTSGVKAAGKALGGALDVPSAPGVVAVVAKADGYLATGRTTFVESAGRARVDIVLKKNPKSRKVTLEKDRIAHGKIPFEFKKPRLQNTAEYALDEIADVMLRNPQVRIRVEVSAEALATPEETQRLADERAAAVAESLIERGVWRGRLEMKGTALAPTDNEKQRKVELVIIP